MRCAGQLDERQVIRGELVVASGNAPAMLDLVEDPLNAVACAVEVRAEADRLPTIAFRRDIGPRTLFVDKRPDPACIVASIGEQHSSRSKTAQQY